jgi:hypothetical protein
MIAVDGKTVRGATDDDGRQPHLVAAVDQHTGAVLARTAVAEKSSEIAAVPVVLSGLPRGDPDRRPHDRDEPGKHDGLGRVETDQQLLGAPPVGISGRWTGS